MWRTNRQIWVTKNSKLVVKTWSLWIVQRVERTIRQKTKKCPRVLFRAFQDSNQSSKLGIMPRWDKEAPENRKSPYSCDPREEEVIGAQKEYLMVHKWNPKLSMVEPPQLYGPHVPVIVLKTSDCCTREPDNLGSMSGVLEEPWIIHILQLI